MRGGPYVEVQKTPGSTTWYNAIIVEFNGDNIRVEFEDDVWPARELPASAARRCPSGAGEGLKPEVGEPLEVFVPATDTSPSGWALGRLRKIKQKSFFFVALEGSSKGPTDVIAEREGVRRVSTEPAISDSTLVRKLIPVDRNLHSWIRSQDSIGCLSDVQLKGKLLMASCTHTRCTSPLESQRRRSGGRLVEIHFKHQITMQRFHLHRDKLMEYLSQRESRYQALHRETFTVDSGFTGRIIGKKGENIRRIQEEFEVNVSIQDPPADDGRDVSTITVSGATDEAVRQAREAMEYIVVKVPIEPEQVGWIVGKGYQNLTEIAQKTELCYARYHDKSSSIELCGLRHQVEDAKMMVSVHRDYLLVYRDMSEERSSIRKRFEELDELDGKGKRGGKGGKKGAARGSGGGQASSSKGSQEYWQEEGRAQASQPPRGRGAGGRRPGTGRGSKGRE